MIRHLPSLAAAVTLLVAAPVVVSAQTTPPPPAKAKPASKTAPAQKKAKYDPYGSPLDTIMTTHLWADVPPAQDFVKTTRPDSKAVDYTPLVGKDPERPKPRDAAGIEALQAELERGGQRNEVRAKGLKGASGGAEQHAARRPAKRKTTAASARVAAPALPASVD